MKILPFVTSIALASALAVTAENGAFAQDPSNPGPYSVSTDVYDFGSWMPSGYPHPIELKAVIKYPTGLPGTFPVALLLHGRHSTCYQGTMPFQEWPCAAGHTPIDSYRGYDYLGDILASNGVVTVSVSVNGINAYDNTIADYGMAFRAETLQRHLDQLNIWNTTGGYPVGDPNKLVGHLDLTRVATMGHSRGGEGVVTHYNLNLMRGQPYGIRGVLPLAAVDFARPNTGNATLYTIESYCDGDVLDLEAVHYFDDARYIGATNPHYGLVVMGANHNYYNTIWTDGIGPSTHATDDWTYNPLGNDPYCSFTQSTNQRETAAQQRAIGGAYMAAFFRTVINNEDFTGYLTGDWGVPASATFPNRPVYQWYHAADAQRRDVNRLLTAANLTTNTLGGSVTTANLTPNDVCGGDSPEGQFCLDRPPGFPDVQYFAWQPDQSPSAIATTRRGLSMHRINWSAAGGPGSITNAIPAGSGNVSGFDSFQFRAGVNFVSDQDTGTVQDMTVTLSDGTNSVSTTVTAASVSGQLFHPPGGYFPHSMGNTIRIPLTFFAGVDLTNVQSVRFDFDQTVTGSLLISDIAFASAPLPPGP